MVTAPERGIAIEASAINPLLKPHQAGTVRWAVHRGCAGIFEAFGLGKTFIQLEIARLIRQHMGRGLGVELSPQYFRDACFYCEAMERQMATPNLFDLLGDDLADPAPVVSDQTVEAS